MPPDIPPADRALNNHRDLVTGFAGLSVWPRPSPPDIPPVDGTLDAIVETLPQALPIVWALALLFLGGCTQAN